MKTSLRVIIPAIIIFSACLPAQAQTLSSSPTLSFSNSTGFADNIAQDGEGGSGAITDFNLQVIPINSAGSIINADPLQYHDGADWFGYPPLLTYGDINPHYGWAIRSDNGNNFSLQSLSFLDWGEFSGFTFVIEAFNNNVSLGSVSFPGNTTENMVVLDHSGVLNSRFQNVDEVRVYRQDGADAWTGLNQIRISTPAAILPVQGLVFTASQQGSAVTLNWKTATEQGTRNFVVQHSINGSSWKDLTSLEAAVNSNTENEYRFIHHPEQKGLHQYRLLQVDLDGDKTYSRIIALDISGNGKRFSIYPNPVLNGRLQIQLNADSRIELYNAHGILVWQKQLTTGTHALSFPQLSKGVYYLRSGEQTTTIVLP